MCRLNGLLNHFATYLSQPHADTSSPPPSNRQVILISGALGGKMQLFQPLSPNLFPSRNTVCVSILKGVERPLRIC